MGRVRFVQPVSVRLDLSDGDWIEVKKRITFGEQQYIATSGVVRRQTMASGIDIDWAAFAVARIVTWLTDWNFLDGNGKSVPITQDAVNTLEPETVDEITKALDAHVEELEASKRGGVGV